MKIRHGLQNVGMHGSPNLASRVGQSVLYSRLECIKQAETTARLVTDEGVTF